MKVPFLEITAVRSSSDDKFLDPDYASDAYWLTKFGSVAAIQTETEQEFKLELALKKWEIVSTTTDPVTNQEIRNISYTGIVNDPSEYDQLEPHLIKAVSDAYPIPAVLREVLREYEFWNDLSSARENVCGWAMPLGVEARILILEEILNTRRAATLDDIEARCEWWYNRTTHDFDLGHDYHHRLHGRIKTDFAIVRRACA